MWHVVHDQRPRLLAVLPDSSATLIVVEHKERVCRFGISHTQMLLAVQSRELVVVTTAETAEDHLTSTIPSLVARIYGRRHAKRKAEQV